MNRILKYSLYFFVLFTSVFYAQVVTIGTSTMDETQGLPIDPFYKFSYSQNIYLSSEINKSGDINVLTFKMAPGRQLNSSNSWVVYLTHTTKTMFTDTSDWVLGPDLTQVYSGTFTHNHGDNIVLTLDTPFNYNGTDNLLIAVEENQDSFDSGNDNLLASPVTENRSIMYRSDTNNPEPNSPPVATAVQTYVANVDISFNTLSINDYDGDNGFKMYPNPSTNKQVIIQMENTGVKEVSVYDLRGRRVSIINSDKNQVKIDLSHLTTGIYMVNVVSENKNSTKKLILK